MISGLPPEAQPFTRRAVLSAVRIAAVVRLTLRDAVRSRVVVSLLVALLVLLIGLPLLVQGDGTPAGRLRILLEYALAAVVGLLSAATLWAGCASMAVELRDRRLFVVLAKPIRRWELWLGKWAGIVLLDAAGLLAAGLIIIAIVAATASGPRTPDLTALLAARETVLPRLAGAASHILFEPVTVKPGDSVDIIFPVIPREPAGRMELRVRLASSHPERLPIASHWTVGPPESPVLVAGVTNHPSLPVVLSIPAGAGGPDGLRLRYTNPRGVDQATTVLDPRAEGIVLLVLGGGFTPNLWRGLAVVLARLAFLAALGVTAGCLLSFPVAVFVAVFALVLLASAGYVDTVAASGAFYIPHEGELPVPGVLDRLILRVFRLLNGVTHPLVTLDPISLLSDGRQVSWAMLCRAAGLLGAAYTCVIAAFGLWLFARREVGLSGTE